MRADELATLSTPRARVVALGGSLLVLAALGPDRLSRLPRICLVRLLLGRCPACGVTRSVAALVRGDLSPRPRRGLGVLVLATLVSVLVADARRLGRRPAS